jgi:hypothetical protein
LRAVGTCLRHARSRIRPMVRISEPFVEPRSVPEMRVASLNMRFASRTLGILSRKSVPQYGRISPKKSRTVVRNPGESRSSEIRTTPRSPGISSLLFESPSREPEDPAIPGLRGPRCGIPGLRGPRCGIPGLRGPRCGIPGIRVPYNHQILGVSPRRRVFRCDIIDSIELNDI